MKINNITKFYRQAGRQAGRQALFLILFFIILFKIDAHADTTTGLVGWWRMDEGSGTTTEDRSGNGNTGTLVNSPTWVAGIRGKALSFNGSNTVSVNHSTSLILSGTKATISTWLKVSSHNSTYREILRKASGGVGYFLLLNAANKIALSTTNNVGEYDNGIAYAADGLWHNVVAILNGSTCFIYIDGVQQTSYACGTISDDGSPLYLASSANTVQFLTGSLDDVRIYNRALTAQDVYMLYLSDNRIRNAVIRNVQFK